MRTKPGTPDCCIGLAVEDPEIADPVERVKIAKDRAVDRIDQAEVLAAKPWSVLKSGFHPVEQRGETRRFVLKNICFPGGIKSRNCVENC